MNEHETTLFGSRIGYNERMRKEEGARKVRHGLGCLWRWFKRRGWILGVVVIALGVFAFQNRFYLQRFNPLELRHLQYVEIEGNRMLSWEDVMQNAQVETGMLMSELNADSVEAALMQLPLILSVDVEKKFPSSLYIKLQEASPVLTVFDGGKATIYSEKGFQLPFSMATAMRLPVLEVESADKVKMMTRFLLVMRESDSELYERVSQLTWDEEDKGIKVFFRDVGYPTLFPSKDWNEEMFTLYKSVENGFVKDLRCAGEVDMRFAGFAYVRNYDKRCVNG